jgi:hypothetical protein
LHFVLESAPLSSAARPTISAIYIAVRRLTAA